MKKLELMASLLTKEMLESTNMPTVTIEQAKLILVYKALKESNWLRNKAADSIMMPQRSFRNYVAVLVKYGFVDKKLRHSEK